MNNDELATRRAQAIAEDRCYVASALHLMSLWWHP